jgi:Tol biopolymer transport system component
MTSALALSVLAVIAVAHDSGGIEVVSPAGRHVATLTSHAGWVDSDPAWSPDGRRLAFTRTMDDYRSFHVYVMRADGSGVRRVTQGRYDWRPAWSPNGRWILYQSTTGLRRVQPDGSGVRRIGAAGIDAAFPSWTASGRIAYARRGWVWTARADGSDRHRLVRGRDAHWSPDGKTIVFTPNNGGVARVPASGGAVTSLGRGYQAEWSADGRQIVFARMGADPLHNTTWVMQRDGSGRRLLARGTSMPAWRP